MAGSSLPAAYKVSSPKFLNSANRLIHYSIEHGLRQYFKDETNRITMKFQNQTDVQDYVSTLGDILFVFVLLCIGNITAAFVFMAELYLNWKFK